MVRQLSSVHVDLLDAISRCAGPLGSRTALEELRAQGHSVSESTVSRSLQDLDRLQLTRAVGRKGRILTDRGRYAVEQRQRETRREAVLEAARDIRDVDELIDQLSTRRGIEREAARAAAVRATPGEVDRLREHVKHPDGQDLPERMGFHRYVANLSHNKQIQAIATTMFHEPAAPLDRLLFVIGSTQGALAAWVQEHREIEKAIRARDPDLAERQMVHHLDSMIAHTQRFAGAGNESVVAALLSDTHRA